MNRFACTIVALSLVPLVTSECVVNTIESNETCVFPFTIFTDNKDGNGSAENNTYFECTTDHDPDKRPWCATKVDSNGVFLKKQWDYCDLESQSCNDDDGTELRSVDFLDLVPEEDALRNGIFNDCYVKDRKTNDYTSCKFPFSLSYEDKFGDLVNQTFFECTTNHDPKNKPWCSTKVDARGLHQKGHWGHCDVGSSGCQDLIVPRIIDDIIMEESHLSRSDCPCMSRHQCPWYFKAIKEASKLRKTARVQFSNLIRGLVCNRRLKHIRCCSLSPEPVTTPSPSQRIPTKSPTSLGSFNDPKLLGTWRPSGRNNECGARLSTQNIVGGKDAGLGEYPFAALLAYQIRGKKYYLCGGSVINSKYIITAAHCHSDDKRIIEVRVGELDLSKDIDCINRFCAPPPQDLEVEEVIHHDNWNFKEFKKGYDIALVRVKGNIELFGSNVEAFVAPVCLPWPSEFIGQSRKGTIIGWGRTSNEETIANKNFHTFGAATDTLQAVQNVPVLGRECQQHFPLNTAIQFCAGEVGKDSCSADSGGAFIDRRGPSGPWYQIGIVSFGNKRCGTGVPGVYTKLSSYTNWIAQNLRP